MAGDDGKRVANGVVLADEPDSDGEGSREDEDEEGEEGNEDGGDGEHSEIC